MSDVAIRDKVRTIAISNGPWAAREWILENLHGEQQAVAFAALMSLIV